ncbi:Gfo/Idh/MocA family protein [Pirellulaceae bacterium SH467]
MKIAIVGCGYVADLYLSTLSLHPELELIGVFDRSQTRLSQFCAYHGVASFESFGQLLRSDAQLVVNLTNPDSHFEITKACLEANKHVYSEKPLAMQWPAALELAELATTSGLILASAPCSVLGEAAQTLWKAVRQRLLGDCYLVYAEMDDGLVHRMPYDRWKSKSGAPWPAEDEFGVGCTLEHAGYVLSWLCAVFGPALSVTAFGSERIPNKISTKSLKSAPDLTVATIRFQSGMVARLTCSIVAEHDHQLRIFCEKGVIGVDDTWDYRSRVWVRKYYSIRRKMFLSPWRSRVKLVGAENRLVRYGGSSYMDFCRGPAEVANAITNNRKCRLSTEFSLHVNELSLKIAGATEVGTTAVLETTFEPISPMDWAV